MISDFELQVTGHAGLQHVIESRQDLFHIFGGDDARQFLRGFVVCHGQIVIGGRKLLRVLLRHRLSMHKETKMRFGEPTCKLVVLFDQGVHNHLGRFQMLEHDRTVRFRIRWRERKELSGIRRKIRIGPLLTVEAVDLSATS